MATYQFSNITSPEAQGYVASRDDLQFFGVTGATATNIEILGSGTFTVRILSTGASVNLGFGAGGEILTLPDGSKLAFPSELDGVISGGTAGDHFYGGSGRDALSGAGGGDILDGGSFEDTLTGGAGADTMIGGGDIDAFVFAPGDSGTAEGQIDVITDWTAGFEKIVFSTAISGGDYTEFTAASYSEALSAANEQIATGATDVVAVRVGNDVFLFADTRNNNGTADDAIKLANKNLDVIAASNISGFTPKAAPPPAPPPTTPPTTPTPTVGTVTYETLTAAQALGYDAAVNDLRFASAGAGSTVTFVGFLDNGNVRVVSGAFGGANQEVVFGPGIYGEANLIYQDNTRVVIGSPGADLLMGAHTTDAIFAGPGNDTLNGGGNPDRLYGGTGADLFVLPTRDQTATIFDTVGDWESVDRLTFGGQIAATASNYVEFAAGGGDALAKITSGEADYVAVAASDSFGAFVSIVADVSGTNTITGRVILRGATLDQIDFSNIIASPVLAFPSISPVPEKASTAAPGPIIYVGLPGVAGGSGTIEGNMDILHVGDLQGAPISSADDNEFHAANNALQLDLTGSGFTYQVANGILLDIPTGVVTRVDAYIAQQGLTLHVGVPSVPATDLYEWILTDDTQAVYAAILGGDNSLGGGQQPDLLRTFGGNDTLGGYGGSDTLWGGTGNDVIYATAPPGRLGIPVTGSTYLRGEEGDDNIYGGTGFDDINGNQGADTAGGAEGDDWVVGGKDSDLLYGDAGGDLVYGNLGADTCEGGAGNDTIRGGQENDIVRGGAGDDFVSGDKGDDTMSGGDGADAFHTFGDAGIDRVLDFSLALGDRVQLDPGTQYTVSQAGADTVIDMTGGGKMILVGVAMSSLTPGWIFGA